MKARNQRLIFVCLMCVCTLFPKRSSALRSRHTLSSLSTYKCLIVIINTYLRSLFALDVIVARCATIQCLRIKCTAGEGLPVNAVTSSGVKPNMESLLYAMDAGLW